MISVTIPGRPMPCPRPRVTGKRTYMPEPYLAWKTMASVLMRDAVVKQNGGRLLEGDVGVSIEFVGAHGSSDIDNLVKSCLDAAIGQVYSDDRNVVSLGAVKMRGEPETRATFYESITPQSDTTPVIY